MKVNSSFQKSWFSLFLVIFEKNYDIREIVHCAESSIHFYSGVQPKMAEVN
jgi:hypothetical protein